jgi:adenylate cyclase
VRRAPDFIRITAQLIEAESGSHVWAETYQRPITPRNILDIQQEIASKIAAVIGGDVGVIVMKEFRESRAKPPADLSAYECNLRSIVYTRTLSSEDHKIARDCLERAVEVEPGYADAWAGLTWAYIDEDRLGYNTRPGALDRALMAAQRAIQLAPENQGAQYGLAGVHFFRGERDAFLVASDRAVALNPNNPVVLADMGLDLAYVGQWEKGLVLINRAMALDPNPPGW